MVLGPKKLLQLVKKINLVTNLSKRELTNPEGAGFDLRLGEVYKIKGKAFLGVTERHTAEILLVAKFQETRNKKQEANKYKIQNPNVKSNPKSKIPKIVIEPGDFFLIKTIEEVNMPENLTASITPRSTTYRSGLMIRAGNVPPGYSGGLTFGLKNAGPVAVTIELGARIVHIQFHEVAGGGNMYRGQWQGGRVTAKKREKQV